LRKTERKNRDEFRKLMDEHTTSGILTAKTHWRDYHSQVNRQSLWLFIFLFTFSIFFLFLLSFIKLLPCFNFVICCLGSLDRLFYSDDDVFFGGPVGKRLTRLSSSGVKHLRFNPKRIV